jgi:hypothetical protein
MLRALLQIHQYQTLFTQKPTFPHFLNSAKTFIYLMLHFTSIFRCIFLRFARLRARQFAGTSAPPSSV